MTHGDLDGPAPGRGHGGDPHALPPGPQRRCLSPDAEGFAGRTPPRRMLWPLLWIALAAGLAYGLLPCGPGAGALPGGQGRAPDDRPR